MCDSNLNKLASHAPKSPLLDAKQKKKTDKTMSWQLCVTALLGLLVAVDSSAATGKKKKTSNMHAIRIKQQSMRSLQQLDTVLKRHVAPISLYDNSDVCDARRGSSCYVMTSELLTWQNASSRCEASGGHLVTIESQAENDAIQNMAFSKFLHKNLVKLKVN